jgi:hypothetical protein
MQFDARNDVSNLRGEGLVHRLRSMVSSLGTSKVLPTFDSVSPRLTKPMIITLATVTQTAQEEGCDHPQLDPDKNKGTEPYLAPYYNDRETGQLQVQVSLSCLPSDVLSTSRSFRRRRARLAGTSHESRGTFLAKRYPGYKLDTANRHGDRWRTARELEAEGQLSPFVAQRVAGFRNQLDQSMPTLRLIKGSVGPLLNVVSWAHPFRNSHQLRLLQIRVSYMQTSTTWPDDLP